MTWHVAFQVRAALECTDELLLPAATVFVFFPRGRCGVLSHLAAKILVPEMSLERISGRTLPSLISCASQFRLTFVENKARPRRNVELRYLARMG